MSRNKQDIKQLQAAVARAELSAELSRQPDLKEQIEAILSGVDSQRTGVKDAARNIIELINAQAPRLESVQG